MARLIIVDPALRGHTGHPFHLDLALAEEARRHGLAPVVLGHVTLDHNPPGLAVLPVFHRSQYDPSGRLPEPAFDTLFLRRLEDSLTPLVADGDIVLFHSVALPLLAPVAAWLRHHHPRVAMAAAVMFMEVDYLDFPAGTPNPAAEEHYRAFFRKCLPLDRGRLMFAAEHGETASDLAGLSGHTQTVGEAPHTLPASFCANHRNTRPPNGTGPLRIAFLGQFFERRGAALLDEVVARVVAARPERARFTVQINPVWSDLGGERIAAIRHRLAQQETVTLHEGPLDPEDFYARLAEADVVLLPYAGRYCRAGSGLFFEALALGKVAVIPADSYMARENARLEGGMVPFQAHTAESVAAAVLHALDAFPDLAARARAVAPAWNAEHTIGRFMEHLVACRPAAGERSRP